MLNRRTPIKYRFVLRMIETGELKEAEGIAYNDAFISLGLTISTAQLYECWRDGECLWHTIIEPDSLRFVDGPRSPETNKENTAG